MPDEKIDFTQDAGVGFEQLDAQDFSAPWLILIQSGSPQVQEGHELYVENARPGRIFSVNSGICYQQCHVVPIRYSFRNVEWKPRKAGGGFVASYERSSTPTDVEVDPLTGITMHHGNEIRATGYYLCMLEEENWDRVIIPLTSTQLKKSRRWNSLMIAQKMNEITLPMFANIYRLSVVREENSKGAWYGWRIDWDRQMGDKQLYNQAKETHEKMLEFLPTKAIAYKTTEGNGKEEPF